MGGIMAFGFLTNLIAGPLVKKIFGTVGSVVNGYLDRKKIREQTKTTIELKKQEVITAHATADITWDKTMSQASGKSWKDEYWTIIISIPAIGAFTPWSDQILAGFQVLEQMPGYYQIFLGTAIGAAFGRNEIINVMRQYAGVKAQGKVLPSS
jgi:hypothetical protein